VRVSRRRVGNEESSERETTTGKTRALVKGFPYGTEVVEGPPHGGALEGQSRFSGGRPPSSETNRVVYDQGDVPQLRGEEKLIKKEDHPQSPGRRTPVILALLREAVKGSS